MEIKTSMVLDWWLVDVKEILPGKLIGVSKI